ncbi:transcription initiation factor TFIID subunit A-domain-containing protein [Podospora appendiculata]|uniref:Transcription initiation factor TFIID subunit A-domain-containing protein n=1 Tax=Podospora appendiculata TaxID=314037 RepID=A0AAE0XC55_9PEZI|nr:transcription initiation factor TFIID subunit A-domain-containing protein [Podospora appendiculata]
MNPAGGQGPPGQGNPQAGAAPNRPTSQPMYRPEMMRNIQLLTEEERGKYEKGLAQLWKMHDASPQGSAENNEAKKKIMDFGKMLFSKVQQRRATILQQQQQQAQQQQQQPIQQPVPNTQAAQQNQQPQAGQADPPQTQMAPVGTGNSNAGNIPSQQTSIPNPTFTTVIPTPMAQASPAMSAATAAAAAAAAQQQAKIFPSHIITHITEMSFQAPPNIPQKDKTKWITDVKAKYAKALLQIETSRNSTARLDQIIKERQEKGPPLTPEELKNFTERKAQFQKSHSEAITFVNNVRKQCGTGNSQKPLQNGNVAANAGGPNPNQGRPQLPGQQGPAQSSQGVANAPVSAIQTSAATVSAAFEVAKNQQIAAARAQVINGMQQQQQQGPGSQLHQAHTPGTPQREQQQQQSQGQPQQQTHQQVHPQHQQPQQQQPHQQQPPIKIEPGTQTHALPAPLNTAIASNSMAMGMQSAGTPTQNSARIQTPLSATPTGANIRPLTHASALSLANQQPQRGGSIAGLGGMGQGGTPSSAPGVIGTVQQQGHPHAHPPSTQTAGQTLQSKMPIPKNLPEKAVQIPTPVLPVGGVGAGRPTYSGGSGVGGGVMNQPALPKTPAFQLEGEGERVLNKKKLDELVRQVCGGTAEGQDGNLLTPEVEESVLNLADAFVDSVLNTACRNAKERGSKVLEIRDLQLVLERTYNIRIPGYSSEELRTVRKVQPNAQWITKMSAVQAAKVMPGKGDL